jgi:hypothetical protein
MGLDIRVVVERLITTIYAGGVSGSKLARTRSTKKTNDTMLTECELDEFIREGLVDEELAASLEQFMKGNICK